MRLLVLTTHGILVVHSLQFGSPEAYGISPLASSSVVTAANKSPFLRGLKKFLVPNYRDPYTPPYQPPPQPSQIDELTTTIDVDALYSLPPEDILAENPLPTLPPEASVEIEDYDAAQKIYDFVESFKDKQQDVLDNVREKVFEVIPEPESAKMAVWNYDSVERTKSVDQVVLAMQQSHREFLEHIKDAPRDPGKVPILADYLLQGKFGVNGVIDRLEYRMENLPQFNTRIPPDYPSSLIVKIPDFTPGSLLDGLKSANLDEFTQNIQTFLTKGVTLTSTQAIDALRLDQFAGWYVASIAVLIAASASVRESSSARVKVHMDEKLVEAVTESETAIKLLQQLSEEKQSMEVKVRELAEVTAAVSRELIKIREEKIQRDYSVAELKSELRIIRNNLASQQMAEMEIRSNLEKAELRLQAETGNLRSQLERKNLVESQLKNQVDFLESRLGKETERLRAAQKDADDAIVEANSQIEALLAEKSGLESKLKEIVEKDKPIPINKGVIGVKQPVSSAIEGINKAFFAETITPPPTTKTIPTPAVKKTRATKKSTKASSDATVSEPKPVPADDKQPDTEDTDKIKPTSLDLPKATITKRTKKSSSKDITEEIPLAEKGQEKEVSEEQSKLMPDELLALEKKVEPDASDISKDTKSKAAKKSNKDELSVAEDLEEKEKVVVATEQETETKQSEKISLAEEGKEKEVSEEQSKLVPDELPALEKKVEPDASDISKDTQSKAAKKSSEDELPVAEDLEEKEKIVVATEQETETKQSAKRPKKRMSRAKSKKSVEESLLSSSSAPSATPVVEEPPPEPETESAPEPVMEPEPAPVLMESEKSDEKPLPPPETIESIQGNFFRSIEESPAEVKSGGTTPLKVKGLSSKKGTRKKTTSKDDSSTDDWSSLTPAAVKRKRVKELSDYLTSKGIPVTDKDGKALKKDALVEAVLTVLV